MNKNIIRNKICQNLDMFFFSSEKKRNSIHPKRTKLHYVGAKSTTQSWVENPKGTQSNWLESQKEKT
jgi:hypothetical protein